MSAPTRYRAFRVFERECHKTLPSRPLQVKPKWVFVDDFGADNGKHIDLWPKITDIVNGLHSLKEFISAPRFATPGNLTAVSRTHG